MSASQAEAEGLGPKVLSLLHARPATIHALLAVAW